MQNALSILFCLSLFYLAVTSRVRAYVSVLALQGLLLTVLLVLPFLDRFSWFALIIPVSIFLVKVILIPRYMNKILRAMNTKRIIEPTIQPFSFLLLVILSVTAVFVATGVLSKTTAIETIPFASGFSAITVGIFLIIFRQKLMVHVAGFLVMENGIFLFGTAVASEMPVIIEIGMLLDVFVVVFLMGIAMTKISSIHADADVNALRGIKN